MNKIIINHKICDQSPACGGIEVCPTQAIFWDEEKNKIGLNESKCIGCGACINACPIRAFKLARSAAEEEKINREIEADSRREEDLFVDRYGADFVDTQGTESEDALNVAQATQGLAVLELNNEDLAACLLMAIPMKDLFDHKYVHIKVVNPEESLLSEFEIKELPAMVFFRDGEQIGKIEGRFEDSIAERELLKSKINKIICS